MPVPAGKPQPRPAKAPETPARRRKPALAPAAGFAAALILTLPALALSRSLPHAPSIAEFLLLLAPPAILMVAGALWPALFAAALVRRGERGDAATPSWTERRLDVLLIDLLAVGAVAGFRRAAQRTSENATLDSILQSILQADTSGIAVLTRSGRVLYASREAERICGPELHAGRGLGASSSIKLFTADGRRLTPIDLIAGSDRELAPPSNAAGTRDLMIVRADEERVWVEYRAMPVRAGSGAGGGHCPDLLGQPRAAPDSDSGQLRRHAPQAPRGARGDAPAHQPAAARQRRRAPYPNSGRRRVGHGAARRPLLFPPVQRPGASRADGSGVALARHSGAGAD